MKHLTLQRCFTLAIIAIAIAFTIASYRYGLWRNGMPGIGLTPFLGALLLIVISLRVLFQKPDPEEREKLQLVPILSGLGICVYVVAFAELGLAIPSFVFLVLWARFLYQRSWRSSLISAAAITVSLVVVFITILQLPLKTWPL